MAKKKTPEANGSNEADLKREIKEACDEIIRLKAQRQLINDRINEKRSSLAEQGIPRSALANALRLYEMEDKEKRRGYLIGYQMCMEALEIGQQGELFIDGDAGDTIEPE